MSITKSGELLIKEAARWMDFVSRLSLEDINKIQHSGLIKPISEYISGINRGSSNMAKRYGYQIEHIKSNNPTKVDLWAKTYPDKKLIQTDIKNIFPHEADQSLLEAIITRHETYEMQAAERALRKYKLKPQKYGSRVLQNFEKTNPSEIGKYNINNLDKQMSLVRKAKYNTPNTGFMVRNGEEKYAPNAKTGHLDIDVLFKERKLVDRIPYPQNPALEEVRRSRHRTGEYQYLDIAGNLGDPQNNINRLERFNKRNARSVIKYGKNPVFVNSADATILEPLF